ncbi:MAG: class II aldolase/adducin family protein [Anaerolineae bacterium]|nr:class II aldolase/adducin family protein [Anaerolineae bacterium]MDW8070175.1 class II aldolase/adducin family protein [Anaerolineae bacterium]
MEDTVLDQLVAMSRHLGQPELDYVILGEGNTSAKADDQTFWVKASGYELRTIGREGFVRVWRDRVLAILDVPDLTDERLKQLLTEAKVDATGGHPSVETVLHAIALGLEGVNFVGHTHPTAINALTCAAAFETAVSGRLFPDEVVVCGPASVVVPYVDPGVPLARAVAERIRRYLDEYGEVPRVILMQNHGLIALGSTPQQVENITAMAVKAARIRLGTYNLGGPRFMSLEAVRRIHTRPDELLRRKIMG